MSTKNRTRRTTTRNIRFPNQMIEQINIALEQKRVRGNSLKWGHGKCRRRLTSEKRAYTSLKVMKNEHPRVLPSEQDDIVNSLNYENGTELGSFTTFPDSDRLRALALSQTK